MARLRRGIVPAGEKAPEFRLRAMDGAEPGAGALTAAGPVVLAFYKVNCPVCQLTLPFLERLKNNGRLRLLPVSQDDMASTARFNQTYGITLETMLDEKATGYQASNGFGITQVPTIFQVESDGTVSFSWEGFSKADMEALGRRAGVEIFGPDDRVPAWRPG